MCTHIHTHNMRTRTHTHTHTRTHTHAHTHTHSHTLSLNSPLNAKLFGGFPVGILYILNHCLVAARNPGISFSTSAMSTYVHKVFTLVHTIGRFTFTIIYVFTIGRFYYSKLYIMSCVVYSIIRKFTTIIFIMIMDLCI